VSAIEHRTTAARESTTGLVPHSPFRIPRFNKGSDKLSYRSRRCMVQMIDGKSVRQKLIGDSDERAVSPVIGVILMVEITVILAAVIAAFVLDMGSNQSSPAQAGLDISNNTTSGMDVIVTSMVDNTETVKCSDTTSHPPGETSEVGGEFKCHSGENIIGINEDGEETVIQSDI